jgi:hypothetical protein
MPKLISSYLRGDGIFCCGDNSGRKCIFISFHNVRQVVVPFEVSFEDGEGVFDGVEIRGVWGEEFELKVCVGNKFLEFL